MRETTFIYALCDPRTDHVRYVGQSVKPRSRLSHHLKPSCPTHLPITRWIRKLKRAGESPVQIIVDAVPRQMADDYERSWIQSFGGPAALLNLDVGGNSGTPHKGRPLSESHRAKISAALTGKPKSLEHRKALSVSRRGMKLSAAHVKSIADSQRGKPKPAQSKAMLKHYQKPEAREKTSVASRKAWSDPIRREEARQRRLGYKHSSITKGRIRVAHIVNNMRAELYGDSIQ